MLQNMTAEIAVASTPSRVLAAARATVCLIPVMFGSAALANAGAPQPRQPNVIVIIADDLGYGDISANGQGKINTPAIDALARQGVRMTAAYATASTCTPSRYSFMTGEYPWRQRNTDILKGDAPLIISPTRLTLPRIFKEAGYVTGLVGKWHLGLGTGTVDFNELVSPGPNELGFDYTFHIPATGDRVPTVYMNNGRVVNLNPKDPITVSYDHKIGTLPTLKENPDQVRLPAGTEQDGTIINGLARIGYMTGGTAAIWQDQSLSDTFNAKALDFIRSNRDKPFFLFYAAHEPHAPRDPNPRFVGKSGLNLRADAVVQLDDQVARLMATLREQGLEDNTIVLLSSDNGALDAAPNNIGGHRANGKLRGGKFSEYEGGVRMPFIARWPGRIPAGTVCGEVMALIDLPAMAASLTRRRLQATEAPDSVDPIPALTACVPTRSQVLLGNPPAPGTPLMPRAIREGDWKLIITPPITPPPRPPGDGDGVSRMGNDEYPQLFNLKTDEGETMNVAKKYPDVVKRLLESLNRASTAGFTRAGAKGATK